MPDTGYYDPKCEELARYFLLEAPEHTENEVLDLAGAIQISVEQWWEKRNRRKTDWQDPDLPVPSNPLK